MVCFRVYIYIVLCLISVRTDDYFDPGVMDRLQQQLNLISETTQLDLNGSNSSVTFHSSVSTHQSHHSNLPNICTLKLPCRNYHLSNPSHKWFAWRTSGLHEGQVVCMNDKWFTWMTSGLHQGQVVCIKDKWFASRTSGLHQGQVLCIKDKCFAWRTSALHEGQVKMLKPIMHILLF